MSETMHPPFVRQLQTAFEQGDPLAKTKQEEQNNVKVLQEQFKAITAGDFAALAALLTEDAELEILGPPSVPFLGRWQGRQQLRDTIARNFALIEDQRPEILTVVAQGDTVVVTGRERGRFRSSGRPYDVHWVQFHTYRGGKTVRIREWIVDTEPGSDSDTITP
jgi:ketosteroid isomerase-like protein